MGIITDQSSGASKLDMESQSAETDTNKRIIPGEAAISNIVINTIVANI